MLHVNLVTRVLLRASVLVCPPVPPAQCDRQPAVRVPVAHPTLVALR